MAPLTIYRDSDVNSTVVSNLFIDEYMGAANDAQLKVYFYLLRMMAAQLATSVSDIADKFNHTEKEVERALKYWEKQNLLTLSFDEDKNLVGIHIKDLSTEQLSGRRTKPAATFVPTPTMPSAEMPASAYPMETALGDTAGTVYPSDISSKDTAELSRSYSSSPGSSPEVLYAADAAAEPASSSKMSASLSPAETDDISVYEKPVYSADQLREFRNRQETAQLLFIAESYIGKPLTPSEVKSILFFTDTLHFSDDLIDYLIQYCVEKGKKNFRYIEKVAVSWAEEGIVTPEQAQAASAGYDKRVYSIMKALGKNSVPTNTELNFINRWTTDYAFNTDIIFEACQRTVLNTDKNRFQYADRMLSMWKEQNVRNTADIAKLDESYRKSKKDGGRTAETGVSARKPVNRFNQFTQNTYDFDALEKKLLSN